MSEVSGEKVTLARVTGDLDVERAPDVRTVITAPAAWLSHGGCLSVAVPRLAQCAGCQGGGCERCNYRGAFSRSEGEGAASSVVIHLPRRHSDGATVVVRLPHQSVHGRVEERPPGHWFIEVQPAADFSPGVTPQLSVADKRVPIWMIGWVLAMLFILVCWLVM